jgi:membrane-associated protein
MDIVSGYGMLLHSVWLLPLLVVLITVDGPLPVLPSETLLMSATAVAAGTRNLPVLVALFLVAVLGSALGDLLVFGLGRGSSRLLRRTTGYECARWVRRHVVHRPGVALVGARFLPGGRLISTAAAGRFGLALPRFLRWSFASSTAWATYVLGIGLLLGPLTGGEPMLSLLAGGVIALLTAAGFAVARQVRGRRVVPTRA